MIEVRDLTIRFGKRRRVAVQDLNLDIRPGQRLGLIGESGSGKSVTALALMGLLPENAEVSGSVKFLGKELIGAKDRELRQLRGQRISMIFQEPMTALDPTMTIGRQLSEVYRLHGRHRKVGPDQASKALARVGLIEAEQLARSYPHELSGGQRQRVMIAIALANDPDLVICDEPTTALDVLVQADILSLLKQELESCLFITHDIAVMAAVCDSVAVMFEGRVVETGTVAEVLHEPKHGYTRGLIATSRMERLPGADRLPTIDDFFVRENQ